MKQISEKIIMILNRNGSLSLPFKEKSLGKEVVKSLHTQGYLPFAPFRSYLDLQSKISSQVVASPIDIIKGMIRVALEAYISQWLAVRVEELLLGTSSPRIEEVNIGKLEEEKVNILLEGFIPFSLLKAIKSFAENLQEKAVQQGAIKGVKLYNLIPRYNPRGIEIEVITNYNSQEVSFLTGVIDLLVVGNGCSITSLRRLALDSHTKLFYIQGSVDYNEGLAKSIVKEAIKNFTNRRKYQIEIPNIKQNALKEISIGKASSQILSKKIQERKIPGIALIGGCNSVRESQDKKTIEIVRSLLKQNILCLAAGCAAESLAKAGLLDAANTNICCGQELKLTLGELSKAENISLPPVLHIGSCSELVRGVEIIKEVEKNASSEQSKIPVVALFPEISQPPAICEAIWTVSLGIPTLIGSPAPVGGSELVYDFFTQKLGNIFGANLILSPEGISSSKMVSKVSRFLKP